MDLLQLTLNLEYSMSKSVEDFRMQKTLGKGTFGKVQQCIHVPTQQLAAVKILQKDKIVSRKDMLRVERQISILKQLHHPNVVQLYQIEQSHKKYYLFTQLAQGEQLFQKINRLGKLSEQVAAGYFMQLFDTVCYLHGKGICHRDIKPQNIIVSGNGLKLIDFGLSNYCREGDMLKTSCGSPCYAAPEMMNDKQYDAQKTQVWALGVTLYAMLTGKLPFEHSNTSKLYKMMLNNQYEEVKGISSSLKSLVRAMIQVKPSIRINLSEIKEHIWVKSQKYEFYQERGEMQWNEAIIRQMINKYAKSESEVKRMILNDFRKQTAFYHLSLSKYQLVDHEKAQTNQYSYHQGPLHLSFIFHSLPSIFSHIKQHYPSWDFNRISKWQQNNLQLSIKKIMGSNMYYLCMNK